MKQPIKIETTPRLQRCSTAGRTPSLLTRLRRYAKHCGQVPLLVGCLALSPIARAVVPPPDGGYAGGNTAEGQNALLSLTTGTYNTALGLFSLRNTTEGNFNTATGSLALASNLSGSENTATGISALALNVDGNENTATGVSALAVNSNGSGNTANGSRALFNNSTGNNNTAAGSQALDNNFDGNDNTAIGYQALFNNTTGIVNTALGTQAGTGVTTANNVICIGSNGQNVPNSCFIGNIRGVTTAQPDAIPVVIDSLGQLGTMSSARRFKTEIQAMDKASEAILALNPVTFHYKSDQTGTPQFGLIAEEVAEVNPDLVAGDKSGEIYTVRYDQINAMLLNEFLKEHKKVEAQQLVMTELKSRVALQQKGMEVMRAQLKEQAAQIQTVTAQIEMSKSAPQIVINPVK